MKSFAKYEATILIYDGNVNEWAYLNILQGLYNRTLGAWVVNYTYSTTLHCKYIPFGPSSSVQQNSSPGWQNSSPEKKIKSWKWQNSSPDQDYNC